MTNRQLEKKVYESLLPLYGHNEAISIQRFLFRAFHGLSEHKWLLLRNEEVLPQLEKQIESALPHLLDFMPVQYVTGKVWFSDLELRIGSGVLIPRQETEELVTLIINKHKDNPQPEILDIGTGSGAIALSIASRLRKARVTAIDLSETAIQFADANARRLEINLNLLKVDIFNPEDCKILGDFDIIVSNPPYVRESEKSLMKQNVLGFEPPEALFVPDADPLLYYRTIIKFAQTHLKSKGELWFEINEIEGKNISDLLGNSGYSEVHSYNDLNGKERFVTALKQF